MAVTIQMKPDRKPFELDEHGRTMCRIMAEIRQARIDMRDSKDDQDAYAEAAARLEGATAEFNRETGRA